LKRGKGGGGKTRREGGRGKHWECGEGPEGGAKLSGYSQKRDGRQGGLAKGEGGDLHLKRGASKWVGKVVKKKTIETKGKACHLKSIKKRRESDRKGVLKRDEQTISDTQKREGGKKKERVGIRKVGKETHVQKLIKGEEQGFGSNDIFRRRPKEKKTDIRPGKRLGEPGN